MRLVIHLNVNPYHIEPQMWEETYQESLLLLQKFPVPLMRVKMEERYDKKRYVYTTALVQDEDSPTEHWEICGDLVSYRHADSFRLYRHLEQEINSREEWDGRDVLWASEDEWYEWDYVGGYGINIFGDKTQGYPYHLAVLAVAILFESRFPHSIYLGGSIERYQVEQLIKWVNTWVSVPVTMPVCLEPKRLYERLEPLYDTSRFVIKRFKTLFCGEEEEALEALLAIASKNAVNRDFIEELSDYQSLPRIGALNLVLRFLGVTQDIRQLMDLVLLAGQSESNQQKFPLEELLRLLSREFLTIDAQEREPLQLFAYPHDELMTIKEALKQLIFRLGRIPDAIDFYIDSSQLLEIFSSYEPEKRCLFRQIIEEGEQTCREILAELGALLDQVKKEALARPSQEEDGISEDDDAPLPPSPPVSPLDMYIIAQVNSQIEDFPNPEQLATQIGKQLQLLIQNHPNIFRSLDNAYYLKYLCRASDENWLVLREKAWQQIDNEPDVALLKGLLALSLIWSPSDDFTRFRIYLLEHKELWHHLAVG